YLRRSIARNDRWPDLPAEFSRVARSGELAAIWADRSEFRQQRDFLRHEQNEVGFVASGPSDLAKGCRRRNGHASLREIARRRPGTAEVAGSRQDQAHQPLARRGGRFDEG